MPLSVVEFDYVRALVEQRSAVVLERDKLYLAEARLTLLARQEGYASAENLVAQLYGVPENGLHRKVVEAMITNETSFFRDVLPFDALRKVVLPELLQRRAQERTLAIWCAACSTGQEPYSIAMLLHEHFPQLGGWQLRLIASDLSCEALQRARHGCYGAMDIHRGLPEHLLARYFRQEDSTWRLRDEIRRMVDYRQINLIGAWPALGPCDVVFLRNVLIYFGLATKQAILARVRQLLRPDGYLFLGGAETTFNVDEGFERVQIDRTVCYRLVTPGAKR